MRVQGGLRGLIAAIEAGRLDPLDATLDERRPSARLKDKDWRAVWRRDSRRARLFRRRERICEASPF